MKRATIVVLFLALWALLTVWTGSNCWFKELVGLPCPGCGSTRAFLALAQGDVPAAFVWHPLWPLTLLIAVIAGCMIVGRFTVRATLDAKRSSFGAFLRNPFERSWFIWVIVIIAAVYFAVYIIRFIFLFPDTAPLDYNEGSLLGRLLASLRA